MQAIDDDIIENLQTKNTLQKAAFILEKRKIKTIQDIKKRSRVPGSFQELRQQRIKI